jgi:hypothetical protein
MNEPEFPGLVPSRRAFTLGDWPQSKFKSINGSEIRIQYGDSETEAKASLSYEHIKDSDVDLFIKHYRESYGTLRRFPLDQKIYSGWKGMTTAGPNQAFRPENARWRYEKPPKITNIRPGISTVQVSLIAVI